MILRKLQVHRALAPIMTDFGASFKKARESKGISLDQIATDTRISTRFLAAIENEDFHLLPGGIFNRGFVRAFAEKVGLDPNQAVADYERLAEAHTPAETNTASNAAASPKIERHLYAVAIGALALLIVIFYIATRDSGSNVETAIPPAKSAALEPPAPAPPATAPETAAAAPEPAPAVEPAPQKEALSLEVQVKETTWIKITADGNLVVPGEILAPGTTRKFAAQNSIDVTIGNAAGLTLKINDMQVKPLGKPGQVREFTITPSNLKDFIG